MSAEFGALSLGLGAAGATFGAFTAKKQAKEQQSALRTQALVADNNATILNWRAEDAIARGVVREAQVKMQGGRLKSRQKASFARRNIALDSPSVLNILDDTDYMTDIDARVTRDNAAMDAWAFRMEAQDQRTNAMLQRRAADQISPSKAFIGSLLGSSRQVAESYYTMQYGIGNNTGGVFGGGESRKLNLGTKIDYPR
ncbi:MAG: hypothetical protein K2X67_03470 [Burkholderiales bacterium]|nr:hypothetical protein [Burkholderiales bacterium]